MSSLDERGQGFENKFAHDQDTLFRITARRNKLLGQWAADLLGLSGDEAAAYAVSVVKADMEEAGDDDVLRKVVGDLIAAEVAVNEQDVREKMDALMHVAQEQITAG